MSEQPQPDPPPDDPRAVAAAVAQRGIPFAVRTAARVAGLVLGANIVGGIVIALLVRSLNGSAPAGERSVVFGVAGSYAAGAVEFGMIFGFVLHRRTLRWLARGTPPSEQDARLALRTPIDLAVITGGLWIIGAVVVGSLVAGLGGLRQQVQAIGGGLVLAGFCTAAVSYLLVGRASRPVIRLVLASYPPRESLLLSLRSRLLLTWLLTSGVPVLGIILVLTTPQDIRQVRNAALVLSVVALAVGALASALTARAIGVPLRGVLDVLQRVGSGTLDTAVEVDDPGEIGRLQDGVNRMIAGLRERDRIHDLFGRHVGPAVAREALRSGVTLSGETRDVVALFVDITGSTALTHRADPRELVAMLNRFFAVVVEAVEDNGGLVNKFEGDAALCIFGAPTDLGDPASAALRAARRIRDAVCAAGEVQVGIGVAAGPVVAGQVGAATRLEYTVIGDAVNEAARLTELAKDSPGSLLASAAVLETASDAERAHWRAAETVTLRGRPSPTRTFVSVAAGPG